MREESVVPDVNDLEDDDDDAATDDEMGEKDKEEILLRAVINNNQRFTKNYSQVASDASQVMQRHSRSLRKAVSISKESF